MVVTAYFTPMRLVAVVYVVIAVVANFFVDHPLVFAAALLAYPVALWLIVGQRRADRGNKTKPHKPVDDRGYGAQKTETA